MGYPPPLYCLFSSFQTNITIFITNICEKCPSSIWYPRPSGHESPPITTRPGLPPQTNKDGDMFVNCKMTTKG